MSQPIKDSKKKKVQQDAPLTRSSGGIMGLVRSRVRENFGREGSTTIAKNYELFRNNQVKIPKRSRESRAVGQNRTEAEMVHNFRQNVSPLGDTKDRNSELEFRPSRHLEQSAIETVNLQSKNKLFSVSQIKNVQGDTSAREIGFFAPKIGSYSDPMWQQGSNNNTPLAGGI